MSRHVPVTILLLVTTLFSGCIDKGGELVPPAPNTDQRQSPPIEPFYPIPTRSQLAWQNAELVMFLHFGMNTFTGNEWGDGTDSPTLFAPTSLDANQWVSVAKETGFTTLILTAKHHDGFCLWPSKFTSYSVANSPYKNGSGDIVREFSAACQRYGVKFGFYLSPWDRHEPMYGTEAYNYFYQNQLTELLTGYGEAAEVWFDGANGDTLRKQDYNWDMYFETVRSYQPGALMAGMGPDIRWIGNENGLGNTTEWSSQPQSATMQISAWGGKVWYPSECDVSIRPGWFYHQNEDGQVKSVDSLTQIYLQTVGRNSNLLLNVPPDKEGRIADIDVARLLSWKQHLDQIFALEILKGQDIVASSVRDNSPDYAPGNCLDGNRKTFWSAERGTIKADLTITLRTSQWINIVRLEEAIDYGQRIASFRLLYRNGDTWTECFRGTTVGRSRIVTFAPVQTTGIKILIDSSFAAPTLRIVKGYYSPLL
jgi:alpha-L-fucosidase